MEATYRRWTGLEGGSEVAHARTASNLWPRRHATIPAMNREFQARFTAILLTLLTVAAVVFFFSTSRASTSRRYPTMHLVDGAERSPGSGSA